MLDWGDDVNIYMQQYDLFRFCALILEGYIVFASMVICNIGFLSLFIFCSWSGKFGGSFVKGFEEFNSVFVYFSFLLSHNESDCCKDIVLDETQNPSDIGALLKEYLGDLLELLLTRELYSPFDATKCKLMKSFNTNGYFISSFRDFGLLSLSLYNWVQVLNIPVLLLVWT